MKKESVLQFVCFVTSLRSEEFLPKWEYYNERLSPSIAEVSLHEFCGSSKARYQYVSTHEWPEKDFQFNFTKRKHSEHFADAPVKVVQAGGYILEDSIEKSGLHADDITVIGFVNHEERDIDFYKELPGFHQLHIFQAYYESCLYGYVLQFSISPADADAFQQNLQKRNTIDCAIYQNCLAAHA